MKTAAKTLELFNEHAVFIAGRNTLSIDDANECRVTINQALILLDKIQRGELKALGREPTEEMMYVAQEADMDHSEHEEWLEWKGDDVKRVHRAMFDAAPSTPEETP